MQRRTVRRELRREIKPAVCVVGKGRDIIVMDGFPEELIFKLSFREK